MTQTARRAGIAGVILLAMWSALSAGGPEERAERDRHDHEDEHPIVRLTDAEIEEFGIRISTAGEGMIESVVSLPGEVVPNADAVAHIVPRYSGIVTEVRARIGDDVSEGEVLAVIESDESLAPFEVRTLIAGTVIAKHITLGEAVSRDSDIYVIADLGTVWIDLTVYQRHVDQVRAGQDASIYVGHALADSAGKVSYVTPVLDERTRTATARVVLPNHGGVWRPGMFVTGRIVVERALVPVAVPLTATQALDEETVIFVAGEEGFEPRSVEVGRVSEKSVEVLSGLSPGEKYVSAGGFTLKAELGKESFGDGHVH